MELKESKETSTEHPVSVKGTSMEQSSPRRRFFGMALMVGGTILISPDALCVNLASRTERTGVVVFYKYLFCTTVQWSLCNFNLKGPKNVWAHIKEAGR
jgi:lipopolysaccharide/colanic/teichoic acid biosynthesis glycosyltransferase